MCGFRPLGSFRQWAPGTLNLVGCRGTAKSLILRTLLQQLCVVRMQSDKNGGEEFTCEKWRRTLGTATAGA